MFGEKGSAGLLSMFERGFQVKTAIAGVNVVRYGVGSPGYPTQEKQKRAELLYMQ